MANQILLIANPTATQYDNVNAANEDVAAYSSGIYTLSDAEQATFAAAHTSAGMIVLPSATPTAAQREVARKAAKILKLGRLPGTETS